MSVQTLAEPWRDNKKWLWLASPGIPALALLFLTLAVATGSGWWFLAMPAFLYLVIPAADWLVGEDASNPPAAEVKDLQGRPFYRFLVFAFLPLQYVVVITATWMAVTLDLAWWEIFGLWYTAASISGFAINTAHELGHKRGKLEAWLSKLALAPVAYGHFYVEHNRGHHKNVATPGDPASAKMGESFFRFLPRTVIGSLISAWNIERERLAMQGRSVWSMHNDNLQAWGLTVVFFGALTLWLGPWALVFLVAQGMWGASLLEVVNYMEHYGLLRQKLESGRYERCRPEHSWNSNTLVSNLLLYQLQRHSDHHAHPSRPYQALRHFDEAPQLPAGYGALFLIAYTPALWFRLMDRRVAAHYGGDLNRANVLPERRKKLFARYHQPQQATPE